MICDDNDDVERELTDDEAVAPLLGSLTFFVIFGRQAAWQQKAWTWRINQ